MNKERVESGLKNMRDDLYVIQALYEKEEGYNEQSIRINQRVRALLNIYSQIVTENRVFDEEYLKKYL